MSSCRAFRSSTVLMAGAKATATKRASTKATATKSSAIRNAIVAPPSKQYRLTGILKVEPFSPSFHKFLGIPEDSHDDVKKLSYFIKSKYRKEIHSDHQLKSILYGKGANKAGFVEIVKLMAPHFGKKGPTP